MTGFAAPSGRAFLDELKALESSPRATPPCRNGGIPHHHCGACGRPTTHTIYASLGGRGVRALCSRCSRYSTARMREHIRARERQLWCTLVGAEGKSIA